MLHRSYANNIRISYLISFLAELYFPITAWLFFFLRYLDFKQIAVITSVSVLTSNLMEIPTGAFADLVGRKKAIFLSFFICSFVMFAYPFNTLFWGFIILEILGGITNSLLSGSLEALTYDSLKVDRRLDQYDKVLANMQTVTWIGLFLSAISGGFLYTFWFRFPWILQGVVFAVAALATLGLHEPTIDSQKYHFKMILSQNLAGFKELFSSLKRSQASIVLILIGSGYFIAGKILGISQARQYGMDARGVGLLFGAGYIITAILSQFFPRLKAWLGKKLLLILTAGLLLSTFILANYVGIILGCLLIIMRISSSTVFGNSRLSIINGFIESKNRATAISTLMLLTQIPFVILSYTIGGYIDKASPNSFALILGLTLVVALVLQQIIFSLKSTH